MELEHLLRTDISPPCPGQQGFLLILFIPGGVKYRSRSMGSALSKDRETSDLLPEEKLAAILETMASSEVELGEYCRKLVGKQHHARIGETC
jgi:hypothetical protein